MLDMTNMVCTIVAVTTPHKAIVNVEGYRIFTKPVKTYVYVCNPVTKDKKERASGLRYYANK